MSNWAELDADNKVIRVLVGNNNELDEGYQWLIDNLGGTWVQTSYNGTQRYNFAGTGFTYDAVADAFIALSPNCGHPELILNTDTYRWECNNAEHTPQI